MTEVKISIRIIMLILTVLLTFQCAGKGIKKEVSLNLIHAEYMHLQPDLIQKEIDGLLELIRKSRGSSPQAETFLKLAFLYSSDRNPAPDYNKAFDELKKYKSLRPEKSKKEFIRNWYGMLNEIVALSGFNNELIVKSDKLIMKNERLQETIERLKNEISTLSKQIKILENEVSTISSKSKKTADKLKQLNEIDVEMEKRRRMIK